LRHAETVQVCGHPPFQRVRACRSPLGCAGRGVYPGQSRAIARRCCGHMVGCRNLPCGCAEICCADWRKGLCRHCRRRRYKPIRDQRIANFITRGAGGSAWDGQSDASTGPLFDIVLRVPQSAGAQVWQRAVGLCPGQHGETACAWNCFCLHTYLWDGARLTCRSDAWGRRRVGTSQCMREESWSLVLGPH
jgi:hypothetical protein